MSQIHLIYLPSLFDTKHEAFQAIFSSSPRILTMSFVVAFLCQRLDLALYSFLKKHLKKKALFLRFGGSAIITQFIDTVLFSFLALYGLIHSLGDIILMSYLIKVIIIFSMAPFISFSKRLMKPTIVVIIKIAIRTLMIMWGFGNETPSY